MDSKVVIGVIGAPFGVEGWVKINSFTNPQDNCLDYQPWVVKQRDQWVNIPVIATKVQGQTILAKFEGYPDRESVRMLTNAELAVPREIFPPTAENEYYWNDLIGMTVVNQDQVTLGQVERIFSTGANDVIVVMGTKKHLLPYIAQVVKQVDEQARVITVEWDPNF